MLVSTLCSCRHSSRHALRSQLFRSRSRDILDWRPCAGCCMPRWHVAVAILSTCQVGQNHEEKPRNTAVNKTRDL